MINFSNSAEPRQQPIRVALYPYSSDPLLPQKDGVNLAHENITALFQQADPSQFEVVYHNFIQLLTDDSYAYEALSDCHWVVCNVGPHAHYYFYLREKLGLNFQILRDVRTAIWSSYLLQEHLIAPLHRPTDLLMVASHYTRALYEQLFPGLHQQQVVRCYPLTINFPAQLPVKPSKPNGSPVVIGYLGRLSDDKNFPDLIKLLIALNQRRPGGYKLVACGDIHSPSCQPQRINQQLQSQLGDGDYFQYLPARSHDQIWAVYRLFDLMVFPSTSNLETLGRVLIEASYAGVPVICGRHAAAPELTEAQSLVAVHYQRHTPFDSHHDYALGKISIEEAIERIVDNNLTASNCFSDYQSHGEKLLAVLRQHCHSGNIYREPLQLHPDQAIFMASLEVTLPEPLTQSQSLDTIAEICQWFLALQLRTSQNYSGYITRLQQITKYPDRTARFVAKQALTNGDFTNVGGIDIELCHVAGFYPCFQITGSN